MKRNRVPSTAILRRLSHNIERLRRARGLSRIDLSIKSGLAVGHINKLENEQRNAGLATLEALTVGFNCDVLDLLQRIPPQGEPIADDDA